MNLRDSAFSGDRSVLKNDTFIGVFKGIVENNEDPIGAARLKIRIFSLHGSPANTEPGDIPWAECIAPSTGMIVPEIGDRVWVAWEQGSRDSPVWLGTWYAIPTGNGTNTQNLRKGSEVPREAWLSTNNKPQSAVLFKSREGNSFFYEDKQIGNTLSGVLNTQDLGGKHFRLETFLTSTEDFKDSTSTHFLRDEDRSIIQDNIRTVGNLSISTKLSRIISIQGEEYALYSISCKLESEAGLNNNSDIDTGLYHRTEASLNSRYSATKHSLVSITNESCNISNTILNLPVDW